MQHWDTADIARAFGVKRKTVTDKWTKRPDFPLAGHGVGELWGP